MTDQKRDLTVLINALAIVGGVSFCAMLMMLPLVGPAGSKATFSMQNQGVFGAVLLLSLLTNGGAV